MASAGEIRAGRAYVELSTRDAQLRAGLQRAQAQLKAFGTALKEVGKGLMVGGSAVLAPLLGGAKVLADFGSQLKDTADRTGIAASRLSELAYAADQSGTDLGAVELAIKKMQRTLVEAASGSDAARDALARVGLTVQDLAGLSPDAQLARIADGLAAIGDPAERTAAAVELFGKSGTDLIPMLSAGAAGLEKFGQRARELGLTMSDEQAAAAEEFGDALATLWAALRGLSMSVGQALVPELQALAAQIAQGTQQAAAWAREHAALIVVTAQLAAGLVALGGGLYALGTAATAASTATKVLHMALVVLTAHPLIAAITLLAAVITAVGVAVWTATTRLAQLKTEMGALRAAGDQERAADLAKLRRLQQLADSQGLTNDQLQEAERLAAQLQGRYGALGIAIDRVAGAVDVAADAFARMAANMRVVALRQLGQELDEVKANIRAITDEINTRGFVWGSTHGVDVLTQQRDEQVARLAELKEQLAALRQGDVGALTGQAPGTLLGTAPLPALPDDRAAQLEEEWAQRVHDLRLELIQNEDERARAKINSRYDLELQRAREAGALQATLAQIEQARLLELAKLQQDIAAKAAEAQRQYLEDLARQEQDIAAGNLGRQRTIAELELRTTIEDEYQLQQALLQLQRQQAVEDALAAGEDVDLVNREFDLRQQLLDQQHATLPQLQRAAVGTFSGEVLGQIGPSTIDEKMARDLAELLRVTKVIEERDRTTRPH